MSRASSTGYGDGGVGQRRRALSRLDPSPTARLSARVVSHLAGGRRRGRRRWRAGGRLTERLGCSLWSRVRPITPLDVTGVLKNLNTHTERVADTRSCHPQRTRNPTFSLLQQWLRGVTPVTFCTSSGIAYAVAPDR